jgi:Spy/CpxP family protein refolding chaperone
MKRVVLAILVVGIHAGATPALAFHEEAGRTVGELVDQFHGFASHLHQYLRGGLGGPAAPVERPLISFMLEHRHELALTPEQASRLEGLRQDFTREAIRRDAEIRIAEMDLAALLHAQPLDLPRVEAKIREVARLQAELRIERIRTIEQGRAALTPEQRTRLQQLLGGPPPPPRRIAEQRVRL